MNGVTKTAVEVPCSSDDARGGVPDPLYIDSGRTVGWVPGGGGCVPDPLGAGWWWLRSRPAVHRQR